MNEAFHNQLIGWKTLHPCSNCACCVCQSKWVATWYLMSAACFVFAQWTFSRWSSWLNFMNTSCSRILSKAAWNKICRLHLLRQLAFTSSSNANNHKWDGDSYRTSITVLLSSNWRRSGDLQLLMTTFLKRHCTPCEKTTQCDKTSQLQLNASGGKPQMQTWATEVSI